MRCYGGGDDTWASGSCESESEEKNGRTNQETVRSIWKVPLKSMCQAGRVWYLEWVYSCQTPWGGECGSNSGGPVPLGPRTGQSRVHPWADWTTQGPWPWRCDSETLGWFVALGWVPERPWLRGQGLSPQQDPAPVWDSKKYDLDLWSQTVDSAKPGRPLLVWDSEKQPLGSGQFKKNMCSVVRRLTIGPTGRRLLSALWYTWCALYQIHKTYTPTHMYNIHTEIWTLQKLNKRHDTKNDSQSFIHLIICHCFVLD